MVRQQNIYWSNILLLASRTQGNHEPQGAYGCGGDCSKGFVCLRYIATDVQDSQEYLNGFCIEKVGIQEYCIWYKEMILKKVWDSVSKNFEFGFLQIFGLLTHQCCLYCIIFFCIVLNCPASSNFKVAHEK